MSETVEQPAWKRPAVFIPVIVVLGVAFAVAMYLFQPWALFTNVEVDEELPVAEATVDPGSAAAASPDSDTTATPAAPQRTTLSSGKFVSQAHPTSGTAKIIQLADGRRVLRLEGFETDNGPDLKVWLSDGRASNADSVTDGEWVSLGELKGNIGNQNYFLDEDLDVDEYRSVLIWCQRFSTSFGAADLKAT